MAEILLTARQLVAELGRLGIGDWKPVTVRQWIKEEPPCPIAERRRAGQSHLYRLSDVIAWLSERAKRTGQSLPNAATAVASSAGSGGGAPACAEPVGIVELAKQHTESELVTRLLEVLEGRDPRNWKASEEAIVLRLKRMEMQRELVPVAEFDGCLVAQRGAFQATLQDLQSRLRQVLRAMQPPEVGIRLMDDEFDAALERLAQAVTLAAGEIQ